MFQCLSVSHSLLSGQARGAAAYVPAGVTFGCGVKPVLQSHAT